MNIVYIRLGYSRKKLGMVNKTEGLKNMQRKIKGTRVDRVRFNLVRKKSIDFIINPYVFTNYVKRV